MKIFKSNEFFEKLKINPMNLNDFNSMFNVDLLTNVRFDKDCLVMGTIVEFADGTYAMYVPKEYFYLITDKFKDMNVDEHDAVFVNYLKNDICWYSLNYYDEYLHDILSDANGFLENESCTVVKIYKAIMPETIYSKTDFLYKFKQYVLKFIHEYNIYISR